MAKWMNFETMFRTLKDGLILYLHEIGVRYELSGCYGGWHFDILCTPEEVALINDWLDENCILEVV